MYENHNKYEQYKRLKLYFKNIIDNYNGLNKKFKNMIDRFRLNYFNPDNIFLIIGGPKWELAKDSIYFIISRHLLRNNIF